MTTELEYQQLIQSYDWDELVTFWQKIQDKNTPDWADGKALEHFILRAFELSGAKVRYPYSVPMSVVSDKNSNRDMEQIDGVVYVNGLACLIECKHYAEPVNFEPIAKLRSQLMRRPSATIASFFSLSGYTEPALLLLNFIQPQTILTWEKMEMDHCLKKKDFGSALIRKYHRAIELGNYNASAIEEEDLL